MTLPAWLNNEGAWVVIGVSLVFVIAALVMHRLVLNVLKAPISELPVAKKSLKDASPHE